MPEAIGGDENQYRNRGVVGSMHQHPGTYGFGYGTGDGQRQSDQEHYQYWTPGPPQLGSVDQSERDRGENYRCDDPHTPSQNGIEKSAEEKFLKQRGHRHS